MPCVTTKSSGITILVASIQSIQPKQPVNSAAFHMALIELRNLSKTYELGEVKVFATAGLVPHMIYHPSGMPFFAASPSD